MPALDHLEPKVISALQKSGWRITDSQFLLRVGKRKVFIDLKAQRVNEDFPEQIIVIEVKGFEGKSSVRDLEEAWGNMSFIVHYLRNTASNFRFFSLCHARHMRAF